MSSILKDGCKVTLNGFDGSDGCGNEGKGGFGLLLNDDYDGYKKIQGQKEGLVAATFFFFPFFFLSVRYLTYRSQRSADPPPGTRCPKNADF